MPEAPHLLNDDGTASMATAFMMSHHAFRRDIARFAVALKQIAAGDTSRADHVREEWQNYRKALHGHHEKEDADIFPNLRSEHTALRPTIDQLAADHRQIDPLLDEGDRAFAELPKTEAAAALVTELAALLDAHLATEEANVVPFLRDFKEFPPPANDAEAEMYAEGFAWSSNGVAPEVLAQVDAMLPKLLESRLAAARAAFNVRCERTWGSSGTAASRTSVPER